MNRHTAIRWWPLIGLPAMVVLGLLVGKASTPIDDWFLRYHHEHPWVWWLLLFTNGRLVVLLFVVTLVIDCWRRQWRLAVVTAVTPIVAVATARLLKHLFGREKVGALAYPSGHVTVSIVVLGLFVVAIGAAVWLFVAAGVCAVIGLLGQAFTLHYFTDTVGAVLLGTSLMCLAVRAAGLDRCQPAATQITPAASMGA